MKVFPYSDLKKALDYVAEGNQALVVSKAATEPPAEEAVDATTSKKARTATKAAAPLAGEHSAMYDLNLDRLKRWSRKDLGRRMPVLEVGTIRQRVELTLDQTRAVMSHPAE